MAEEERNGTQANNDARLWAKETTHAVRTHPHQTILQLWHDDTPVKPD